MRFLMIGSLALVFPAAAQESDAILDAPLVVVPPTQRIHHLLDWNGDGLQDFAVVDGTVGPDGSLGDYGVKAFLNDGRGGMVRVPGIGAGGVFARTHMETFDATGDGRDDLVWLEPADGSSSYPGSLSVLTVRDGRLRHVPHLETGLTESVDLAAVLDADGDGDADRVLVHSRTLELELFGEDGGGTWTKTESALALPSLPRALVEMDFDGDAFTDLYLHSASRGCFVSLADGSLHDPVILEHGIEASSTAIPGDVDGDGDQDLAIFDAEGYRVNRRTGPASWVLEPRRTGGPAAKLADVDLDGDLDGVSCSSGSPTPRTRTFDEPSTFRVSLNDGTGAFAPAFTIPGLGALEIAGAADLDRDGDVDLAAGQCIYFARGPLARPPQRALAGAQSTRSLADYDRDGDPDFTAGIGTFARNSGDGSARPHTLLCPPAAAGTTDEGPGLPGDWDGDGDVDLLVRRVQGAAFLEMRLLRNEGGGTFADGGTAGTTDFLPGLAQVRPESFFAVDLDLDRDLDLVTFLRGDPPVAHWTRTWLNDGTGRFTLAQQLGGMWPLAFGALHGDPAPDAVMAMDTSPGSSSSRIGVFPGLGDGSFGSVSALDLHLGHAGPASIALADFDLDGDLDLAGAFQFGGLWGEGKAWFLPQVDGTLSLDDRVLLDDLQGSTDSDHAAPRIAVAGDVDGDGLEDVLLASPLLRSSAVAIVRRRGDNQGWLPPVYQVVYREDPANPGEAAAIPGACLDVDGDGDAEYVTDVIWNNAVRGPREWGARRQRVGGRGDADGRVPVLGASGSYRPGERVVLRLSGVPSGVIGVLNVSQPDAGTRALALPERFGQLFWFLTQGPATPGGGGWRGAYTAPSSVAGQEFHLRVDLFDQRTLKLLRSNVLELNFGR